MSNLWDEATVLTVGPCLTDGTARDELGARLSKQGYRVVQAATAREAECLLLKSGVAPALIVIDLDLPCGVPLVLADLAAWRHPTARLILMSSGSLFADGAMFRHAPTACAMLPAGIALDDLIEVIAFHAGPPPGVFPTGARPSY
jgi:DNA-binding NtrC family response regulator